MARTGSGDWGCRGNWRRPPQGLRRNRRRRDGSNSAAARLRSASRPRPLRRCRFPNRPRARCGSRGRRRGAGRFRYLRPRHHRSGMDGADRFEIANIRSPIAKIGEARRRRGLNRPGAERLPRASGADAAEHASSDRRRRPSAAVCEDPGDLCACRAAVARHSGAAARFRPRSSMQSSLSRPQRRCPWRPAPWRPRARTPSPRPRSCRRARPATGRAPPHSERPSA